MKPLFLLLLVLSVYIIIEISIFTYNFVSWLHANEDK